MGILKRFNEIFGLEDGIEDERKRFVQRVNQAIFHEIDFVQPINFDYETLFECICFELGVNAHDIDWRSHDAPPSLKTLTKDDFTTTLQVLLALYVHIEMQSDKKMGQKWLSDRIKISLSRCTLDIGVRWKDGFFYPSGAEELDKPLIEESLTWLNDFPNEGKDFRTALQCFMAGDSLTDVIKNCYSAVEGVVRAVLGNDRTLDNNKIELLAKINLSDGWKSLLANYINYAHDYRHASPERHDITKQEAEAYLYMTGLIIRLTIESIKAS